MKPGDDLEGDRYLITVEAEKATENNCTHPPKKIEASTSNRNGVKLSSLPLLHRPVGLKRKFTVCLCMSLFHMLYLKINIFKNCIPFKTLLEN